jgi:hypothetical protein
MAEITQQADQPRLAGAQGVGFVEQDVEAAPASRGAEGAQGRVARGIFQAQVVERALVQAKPAYGGAEQGVESCLVSRCRVESLCTHARPFLSILDPAVLQPFVQPWQQGVG